MHKGVYIVRKLEDLAPCVNWMEDHLALGPIEVSVTTETKQRSVQQNRLMWLWNTEIGSRLALLKDEVHVILKRKFAVPIFMRDDEGYCEMILAIKSARKDMNNYEAVANKIADITSTTDFKVAQMSEYLNNVEYFAAEQGANLTFPADLYGYK